MFLLRITEGLAANHHSAAVSGTGLYRSGRVGVPSNSGDVGCQPAWDCRQHPTLSEAVFKMVAARRWFCSP